MAATQTQTVLNRQLVMDSQAAVLVNLKNQAKLQLDLPLRSNTRSTLTNRAICNLLLTVTLTAILLTATHSKLRSSLLLTATLNKVNTQA